MTTSEFLKGQGTPGLVSIIIPTYNRADLVGATIESALAQTYDHLELIVVDDGSVDDTRAVVARYTDPRVQYFHKDNGGLSHARNFGLDRVAGEYIAFLDSDDLWYPWKLKAQVALFRRHPDVGMIWSDMSTFTEPGVIIAERNLREGYAVYQSVRIEELCQRKGSLRDLDPEAPAVHLDSRYLVGNIFDAMFLGNLVHPPTAIVRRDRLRQAGGFERDVTGDGGEDHHFYTKISELGPVALLDAPTILYRVHESQQHRKHALKEARGDVKVVEHWLRRHPPAHPASVIRARRARAHAWQGFEELHGGDRGAARQHLWRSLTLVPQPRTAALLAASFVPPTMMPFMRRSLQQARALSFGFLVKLAGVTGLLYLLLRLLMNLEPELVEV